MNRVERIFRIHRELQPGQRVPFNKFCDKLEISPATLKRDIAYMRITHPQGRLRICPLLMPAGNIQYAGVAWRWTAMRRRLALRIARFCPIPNGG